MTDDVERRSYTYEDAARVCEVSPETIRARARRGALSPAFATGDPESSKWLISRRRARQGRHHKMGGHSAPGTSSEVILGGGCAGKRIFNCRSRSA